MDKSNGYEGIAAVFIKGRGQAISGIGASSVRGWARTLVEVLVIFYLHL